MPEYSISQIEKSEECPLQNRLISFRKEAEECNLQISRALRLER